MTYSNWNSPVGRELDRTPLEDTPVQRIVACLNVWNDVNALKVTVPIWAPFVDRIIVVDGSYQADDGLSDDGTREFLAEYPQVEIIDAAGLSQCEKRTKYLEAGRPGDYLFIIDADEEVQDPKNLRSIPVCDVGWIRMRSKLYVREYGQPRIIRYRPGLHYDLRHHWIYNGDRSLLCTHQYGGAGFEHRPVNLHITNRRQLGRPPERIRVKRQIQQEQSATEFHQSATPRSVASDSQTTARESLQILNHAYRDDGLAPSRLHTAINRTTPHSSLFFKSQAGPFGGPEQYSTREHPRELADALSTADVIHFHGVMSIADRGARTIPTVFHHHGSMLRSNHVTYNKQARERGALVLVSNLELLSWTDGLDAHFLPNTVPVARYAQLAEHSRLPFSETQPFRVAHSPSKPERKGTDQFLLACQHLSERGVPIEPVMIHGVDHGQALAMKATCHAAFDSFWLGIQCSGIESAAMHMPVIAGDETVAERYRTKFGGVPYTFANSLEELEHALFRLIDDTTYYAQEMERVHRYVVDFHDESSVALQYLDYLDTAFGWRSKQTRRTLQFAGPSLPIGRRSMR